MNRTMVGILALLVLTLPLASRPVHSEGAASFDEKAAFERLKSLATWQGAPETADTAVRYELTGAGNAVMEVQHPGTPRQMTSVFYLDQGHLVLTHYCVANQPHLRLDTAASTPDRLVFAFAGGSNLDPAQDGHLHSGTIQLKADRVESDWAVYYKGKELRVDHFRLSPK
jgi:hypothetical protein